MARAARAELVARATWPSSAAAPEYSARRSAAVSAVMERKNARTAGRSALAQSCAMVDLAALIFSSEEGKSRFLAPLGMTTLFVFGQTLMKWRFVTATRSQGNGNGFNDIAKNGIGGLRFFLQRGVARTRDNAMRENGNGELLEIVGEAVVTPIQESAGLR